MIRFLISGLIAGAVLYAAPYVAFAILVIR